MNKFYLIIFFIGFTFCARAQQQGKINFNDASTGLGPVKLVNTYPNPAITVVNFQFIKPAPKDLTLQIYNFIGKKIFEASNVSQKTTITLNEVFLRGVYIYQLKDKTGRIVESGKFQVNK